MTIPSHLFVLFNHTSSACLHPFSFREGNLVDLRFERNANQSLGIAFNIPARVSAMNWVSQQRLVGISALSITSLHARVQFCTLFCIKHP